MDHAFTHQQIEALAHELWELAGRPEGRAIEHWIEAERRLAACTSANKDPGQWHPAAAAHREHEIHEA